MAHSPVTIGVWCAIAAYMRLAGFPNIKSILDAALDGKTSGLVQSTRNEIIARIFSLAFELAYIAYVSYSIGAFLDAEARTGNDFARRLSAMWVLVMLFIMVFVPERKMTPAGSAVVFILVVDWIIRVISPKQANVAREQEEALVDVGDDTKS